ncbi:S8 family peptidase [Oscillospiraceae bacterium LTW-04]|nr:S8 family peptidase [Oscillospiraceae bacterium MB24-C1]
MDNSDLYSEDIVDFFIRKGAYFERFIFEHPGFITSHTINDTYTICYATRDGYEEMARFMGSEPGLPNVLGLLGRSELEASGITQIQQQPYLDLKGQGVLIGFLDTGIDYTKDVFKKSDGTSKIEFIYDQSIPGTPPDGFPIGAEFTKEQINAALASESPQSVLPHIDDAGHGTFLASVAAGSAHGDFIGAAPEAGIIMVKLKKAYPFMREQLLIPEEQQNAFESTSVILGVEYIIKKARQLDCPVVICIGLGSNYDNHDGSSPLEDYLFDVSNIPGVCVCVAAGNESQAKHHYYNRFTRDKAPMNIDIQVGQNAGNILITITNRLSDIISVSVRSPTGELVKRVPAKPLLTQVTKLVLEKSEVSISYSFPVSSSGDQVTVVRIHNATPGLWTITAYGDFIIDGSIFAWLPMTGFISPNVEFLSSIPYNTITFPATGLGPICCGAYNSVRNILYPLSSWGPTRMQNDVPDLLAPGYQIGGIYPTGFGYMSGTSCSAAITAGASALLMQWGIVKGHDFGFCTPVIRAYLIRGCNRNELIVYPNNQWGFGMLNLTRTFYYMREL